MVRPVSQNSSSYRTFPLENSISQEQHKSMSYLATDLFSPMWDLVIQPSSSTGTYRHRRHREQAEDLRTHLHQALNFVFSPTEGKMSTNHWEQGQWKNWPSEHICFQSSENLISTCGLLRLFFFSFRCWTRVGGLFLIPPLQSVSGLRCRDRQCRCGDSSIRKSEGYYAKRGQRARVHSPHQTASSSCVTFLSLLRN